MKDSERTYHGIGWTDEKLKSLRDGNLEAFGASKTITPNALTKEEKEVCKSTRAHKFMEGVWRDVTRPLYTPEFCVANLRELCRLYYEQMGEKPPEFSEDGRKVKAVE